MPNPSVLPLISNSAFLRAAAGDDAGLVRVVLFAGDPANQAPSVWKAYPAKQMLTLASADQALLNTYYSVSIQSGEARSAAGFQKLFAVVVDDVGVKVDRDVAVALIGREPSYELETSPGNSQIGWFTSLTSPEWTSDLLAAIHRELGERGDNIKNLVTLVRLPVGTNGKMKYRTADQPRGFEHRLLGWRPHVRMDMAAWQRVIADRLGGQARVTGARHGSPGAFRGFAVAAGFDPVEERPDPGELVDDAILIALQNLGRIIGPLRQSTMGWVYDIRCPWSDQHTDRLDSGAVYAPVKQTFKCFHGHCQARTSADLRPRLDELLKEGGLPATPAGAPAASVAALEFGAEPVRLPEGLLPDIPPAPGETELRPLGAYELSEDGCARAFADRFADRYRYDHDRGRWYRWVGDYWQRDAVEAVRCEILVLSRAFKHAHVDATAAQMRVIGKTGFVSAVERTLRYFDEFACDNSGWDRDPWRIGVPGGEIDLRTGRLEPPDPAHMISRQCLVAPDFEMETPVWNRLLFDATGADLEVIGFIHAWFGYGLTGDTSEQRFVFIWGPGGNGKSTMLTAVSAIMHDYAGRAPSEMFMHRKHPEHREEIARLAGLRSVTASEIESGQTFNAARVKDFTGSDKLVARFMHQGSFEFVPSFKLTFVGNNQPGLTGVDRAIERRLILVPITEVPQIVDETLSERLVDEYPGILAKLLRGEIERRRIGLSKLIPNAAVDATGEYLAEQDSIGNWMENNCEFDPGFSVLVSVALDNYRDWCRENTLAFGASHNDFAQKVLQHNNLCRKGRSSRGSIIVGMRLAKMEAV